MAEILQKVVSAQAHDVMFGATAKCVKSGCRITLSYFMRLHRSIHYGQNRSRKLSTPNAFGRW